MAVFLINICKFNGCFKTFPSLSDLISHIEDTHIDYDPKVVEQKELAQPASLPLSYVLRFISDDARKEASTFLSNTTNNSSASNNNNSTNATNTGSGGNTGNAELKRKLAIKHHSYSMSSSNRSNTPTGSEMDEDEMVVTESEDSNDSWTTEEFSSEFIMRYGSRHSGGGSNGTPGNEKPFACPVPGCKKRYKNVNGIKYHSKNGHKKDGRVRKGYKCHCGKSYKTAQGLKNHALLTHNTQPESVLTTQQLANLTAASAAADTEPVTRCKPAVNNGLVGGNSVLTSNGNGNGLIQRSNSPSQSLGSLSPSSSNMSSSTSTSGLGAGSLGSNSLSSTAATASNMLQQLSNGNIVTVTNVPQQQQPQQALPQQQQLQQQQQQMNIGTQSQNANAPTAATATTNTTGNSNNSLMRSTLGLVSIKANNNHNNNTVAAVAGGNNNNPKSVSNLIAANATANKILKLATNVANGVDIAQQHKLVDNMPKANGNNVATTAVVANSNNNNNTPTKITLPNLVNLGILTPATSPTKNTQTLTFTTTAGHNLQQQQQQQALVASLTSNMLQQQQKLPNVTKTNILLLQEPNTVTTHLIQSPPQQQQQQHVLPISPTSSISSSKSSSPTPTHQQQQQQQLHQLTKSSATVALKQKHVMTNSIALSAATSASTVEPMETDELPIVATATDALADNSHATVVGGTVDSKDMPSSIAAAVTSGTITVAAIEVVGAGVVNTET
ncbi:uncharacterized protein DDB_G0288805 isoform X1 [Drosophila albomicans]|uniref:Uncharacterized protein DDB_G0288805 isoform X1 n=1 Tax=Drosophila albomicans TaxID=7291 RepID=A0A6P8XKK3_DROAB|nr:uncharacterized protein DDB_G0288805 isoform X1 [Drosophila albomicans]